jgi:predicted nucleic acid-binding protein
MAKKAVRVFLDSNVILSGLFSEKGAPRIILDVLSLRLPFLVCSTGRYNLIEVERNLEKKMPGVLSVYKSYLSRLNLKITPLPQRREVRQWSGHIADKDIPVLLSAIQSKADFLVTGDKEHFEKLKSSVQYPFKIVSPAEFLDVFLPEILKRIQKND